MVLVVEGTPLGLHGNSIYTYTSVHTLMYLFISLYLSLHFIGTQKQQKAKPSMPLNRLVSGCKSAEPHGGAQARDHTGEDGPGREGWIEPGINRCEDQCSEAK